MRVPFEVAQAEFVLERWVRGVVVRAARLRHELIGNDAALVADAARRVRDSEHVPELMRNRSAVAIGIRVRRAVRLVHDHPDFSSERVERRVAAPGNQDATVSGAPPAIEVGVIDGVTGHDFHEGHVIGRTQLAVQRAWAGQPKGVGAHERCAGPADANRTIAPTQVLVPHRDSAAGRVRVVERAHGDGTALDDIANGVPPSEDRWSRIVRIVRRLGRIGIGPGEIDRTPDQNQAQHEHSADRRDQPEVSSAGHGHSHSPVSLICVVVVHSEATIRSMIAKLAGSSSL